MAIDQSKLKKIPAGKAKVIPANLNVHIAGVPKSIPVRPPVVMTPGTGPFSLPKTILAIDSPFVARQPKPVSALPFRMKDAATYNIQYLDVDQGMNSSVVNSMLEDKNGNIWFATETGGVSKYDGQSFTHFTKEVGINSNGVWSVLEDKNGNLWFGTNGGGVSKYDGKYLTNYTVKEGLSNNAVSAMLEDKNGNLWFGTEAGGVSKYDGKSFTHYTSEAGLGSDDISSITEDNAGNLWFGTNGGGVSKYDGKSFTHYTVNEGLCNNIIYSILEDRNGSLWFGSNGGLSKYDGKSFTTYTDKDGLSGNTVKTMLEDKDGNLWFGTDGGGVSKYNGTSFTHFTDKEGLSSNYVLAMLEDKNGNMWFGTFGGGVSKYDRKSFRHYIDNKGLGNVQSMLEDKSGNLWFGTYGSGVLKYDGKSFTCYTEKEGLCNNTVWSMLEDKNGCLWFGTNGRGISKFDGKFFTNYSTKNGLSGNLILSMIEDNNGHLWFGTVDGGVSRYDGKSFRHYSFAEGLSSNVIFSIQEDRKGNLWFGTSGGGVTKYDGKSFTHYTVNEGLSDNDIFSILEDKNGNLWFGTGSGGVSVYNGKSFTNYTDKEGLTSNTVWSMLENKNSKTGTEIWLGTEKGLNNLVMNAGGLPAAQLQNSEEKKDIRIIAFHKEDGLKAEDFFQNSVLLDSKNRIWWGSGKALSMLDLNEFKLNETEPHMQLDNIYLQERFVDYRSIKAEMGDRRIKNENEELKKIKFKDVANFHNYPEDLKLPYYLNHLTFQFSAIDWYAPHKLKYQYKLEHLDQQWNNLTADNKADYRNIPFGKYTFKVKAIGSAGKWSKTVEYPFVIYPPWWRTWWAYVLFGLTAISVVITIIWWNGKRLRTRANELKMKIEKATVEIKEQKNLIEEKHREIKDSINYAERIQRALLVGKNMLDENLSDYFILFKPKDVVSGDFYWATKLSNNNFALVTADSTGHGVPGAIMSIVNIACLKEASLQGIIRPDLLLDATRKLVIENLKNDGSAEGGKDGMDGCLLSFDFNSNVLQCASAYNPVLIIRDKKIIEIEANRFPIGKHEKDNEPFTLHTFNLQTGDMVYTLTDGFAYQFGGPYGKKFKYRKLLELLLSVSHEALPVQKQKLNDTFDNWKGNLEQVDDVCLIGIRI